MRTKIKRVLVFQVLLLQVLDFQVLGLWTFDTVNKGTLHQGERYITRSEVWIILHNKLNANSIPVLSGKKSRSLHSSLVQVETIISKSNLNLHPVRQVSLYCSGLFVHFSPKDKQFSISKL